MAPSIRSLARFLLLRLHRQARRKSRLLLVVARRLRVLAPRLVLALLVAQLPGPAGRRVRVERPKRLVEVESGRRGLPRPDGRVARRWLRTLRVGVAFALPRARLARVSPLERVSMDVGSVDEKV